jgi:glycosyltransferase involved in cell wall biosynthesis
MDYKYEIPFNWNKHVFGGTEYMAKEWNQRLFPLLPNFNKYKCFVLPGLFPTVETLLEYEEEFIIWIHNTLEQFDAKTQEQLLNLKVQEKTKFFVALTETHKKSLLKSLNISEEKVVVINNAISPLQVDYSKFSNIDKIRLIHISNPERGLKTLLKSLKYIKHDFQLDIFNSFYPEIMTDSSEFSEALNDSRVTFYGTTPKATVAKYLSKAHIHVYPCEYEETFCLSQIEALSAGCASIFSNTPTLKEVSKEFGFPYSPTNTHEVAFSNMVNYVINSIKTTTFDPTEQVVSINKAYEWNAIETSWRKLHGRL